MFSLLGFMGEKITLLLEQPFIKEKKIINEDHCILYLDYRYET